MRIRVFFSLTERTTDFKLASNSSLTYRFELKFLSWHREFVSPGAGS